MGRTMTQSESKPEQFTAAHAPKPLIFSILILISGIIIGAGLMLIISAETEATPNPNPGTEPVEPNDVVNSQPPPSEMIDTWVNSYAHAYKLTNEQKENLRPILIKWATEMEILRLLDIKYRNDHFTKINRETNKMHKEFTAILNDWQKERFNRQFAPEWNRINRSMNPFQMNQSPGFQQDRNYRRSGRETWRDGRSQDERNQDQSPSENFGGG